VRTGQKQENKQRIQVILMEIELTNHQDVAEPDQVASGVAGTGLKNGMETGIVRYATIKDTEEFFSDEGVGRLRHAAENREGFSVPPGSLELRIYPQGSIAIGGNTRNPRGSGEITGTPKDNPVVLPVLREKVRKDRIVIGMGVLHNGEMRSARPGRMLSPEGCDQESAASSATRLPASADPGQEPVECFEDIIVAACERQDRIADRQDRKISWSDREQARSGELTMIRSEERRLAETNERRRLE